MIFSKMRAYQKGCDEAARKVAAPVLEWLTEQNPGKEYDAFFSSWHLRDGPGAYHSNVYQIGPGLLKRVWPKKIAIIQDWGHVKYYARESRKRKILPQEKLEQLMEGVSLKDIREIWKNDKPARPKSLMERIGDYLEDA